MLCADRLENSPPFDGVRFNLRWLPEAVPLPNLHGSKLQLANTLGLLVHILLHATRRVVGQPDRSLPSLVDHDRRAESVR